MSFNDNNFDLIISQSVLEHIFDIKKALSELLRITRPNGACVIMVPFFRDLKKTEMLAREKENGQIEHIKIPPEIHGNPLSGDGILAYWHHGWEFTEIMKEAGWQNVKVNFYNNVFKGYFGVQAIITGNKL